MDRRRDDRLGRCSAGANTNANSYANGNTYYAATDPYSYLYPHFNTDSYSDANINGCSYSDSNSYSYSYADANADSDQYSDTDANAYSYAGSSIIFQR
jgi:hypothetical protein